MSVEPSPPLAGYVVVDLSSGIAGAYCTKVLADGGAEVFKVEPPEGDPLRAWSASGADIPPDVDGALFGYLSSSKKSLTADPELDEDIARVHALLQRADAVVWSKGSRLSEHPDLAPDAIRGAAPHLTVTTITPFGLEGPWHDRAATEFTLQALSGGIVGLGRGAADRPPVFVGGQIGEWLTGVYAAIGTMVSRARALDDGPGELVDVSMLETLTLSLTYYPVSYHDMVGRPFRKGRSLVTPGVESTSDGLVGLGVGTGQQWLDFCAMSGHPEWAEDRSLFVNRTHLGPEIATWAAGLTTAEVLEIAALFRIPHAPIGNGASIPTVDHLLERGSIATNPRSGVVEPARPYRFDPTLLRDPDPAPHLGEHDAVWSEPLPVNSRVDVAGASGSFPFAGLRVLDLTAFWAGPLCTHILAMLGAEVMHVESVARPDGTRMLSGVRFSEPDWWEQSGIFSGLNTNKSSVTLDLASDRGRELIRELLATCDVLVENYTPRVLDQIGLDIDTIRSIRSDLVVVRMPGFGLDGPWRDNPAFAFVVEDASGLTWMTGHPDQNPVSPYCVGDSNAGIHALSGLLLALEHRRRTGEGVLVEAAMVDAALNVAAEQLVEQSAYGALLGRDGNRGPTAAPQNLYLAADADENDKRDTWVAVAVATDEQWLALRDALGQPEWAMDSLLTEEAGRRQSHSLIDTELSNWCMGRSADEIVDQLWGAGVPTAKVMQPQDQASLAQLQFREFFEDVDHPVTGTARHATLPMKFSRGPRRLHRSRAPLLGEHTETVLEALGVSEDELVELQASGVIGRTPVRG